MPSTISRVALFLVALAGAARADGDAPAAFPHMIAVTSIAAPSVTDDDDNHLISILTSLGATWCEAKPNGGVGQPLTIVLGEPTAIDVIAVRADDQAPLNTITSVTITADGTVHKETAVAGKDEVEVAIGGAPVSRISVVVTGHPQGDQDTNCVRRIELRTHPPSAIVFGVDAKAAAALEPAVVALEDAFRTCDRKGFAALAHPFTFTTVSEDNDGMKWHPHRYKTAAAAAKACKAKKLRHIATSLPRADLMVQVRIAGKIELLDDGMSWELELIDGQWRLRSVGEGG